jgi:glycosyltransferase involved in cell wall biosynthesis
MKITVILCTLNRCQSLAKTLESLTASALPDSVKWEVLVVDNNSTDHTREVVEDFCGRYPDLLRYVFEPQPGKSFALNTGVREAQGDVLAFLDDDVTVEPTWLQNLTASLQEGEWAGVGGRTLPAQTFSPPRWLSIEEPHNLGGVLCALFDLGDQPRELDRAPYGTNMAFQKKMFQKYGLFRTDLGPSPNRETPRPNEDTEFGRRLMAAGECLRYEPSAVVYHEVPQDRLKKEYFLAWWFDYGRAATREVGKRPDIWGIPRPYLTMLKAVTLLAGVRTLRWMFALNPKWRFYCKCWVWKTAGEIAEIYRQSFDRSRPKDIEGRETKTQWDSRT